MNKELLQRCESFISGFEGDESQEGIDELLTDLRAAIDTKEIVYLVLADWHDYRKDEWAREVWLGGVYSDESEAIADFQLHTDDFPRGEKAPRFVKTLKIEV